MLKLPYCEVNAFVAQGMLGNPAGVCPLKEWLPVETMQKIAEQNNLSETAFIVANSEGYDLRWFTPTSEIDLCGHATLASAHVIWNHLDYKSERIKFNSCSGVLEVVKSGELMSLNFPARAGSEVAWRSDYETVFKRQDVSDIRLSRDLMFVLKSESQVRDFKPDFVEIAKFEGFGMLITAPGDKVDFVSRFFLPHDNIPEDPVTGSTHCMLIPYWAERLGRSDMVAQQLSARGGELFCRDLGERVEMSGRAATYLTGEISI